MRLSDEVDYQEGGIVSKVVMKTAAGSVTLFAFAAGQALSEHTAPFDALVHCLEGTAMVTIDGREQAVEPGHSVVMPANVPHAVAAREPFKMLLTMLRA